MIIILQTTVDAAELIRRSQKPYNPKTPLNSFSLHTVIICCRIGCWRPLDGLPTDSQT